MQPQGGVPRLAVGLGGVGITLHDFPMLYARLAGFGSVLSLCGEEGRPQSRADWLLSRVAAWYVGNILIGAAPPPHVPPGRIAFTTGTSYGYCDAWRSASTGA